MNDDYEHLPFFTKVFYHLMRFITKYSKVVLAITVLITVFFVYQLTRLEIDADVQSLAKGAPANEYVLTPSEAPEGERLTFTSTSPEVEDDMHYGYTERAESEKLHAVIPPQSGIKPESYSDNFFFLFTSDLLYTPEVLNLLEDVMGEIAKLDFIGSRLSAFDFVTAEKVGSRIAVVPMSPLRDGEAWSNENVEVFKNRLLNDRVARGYLCSEDGNSILIYYSAGPYGEEEIELVNAIVDPLRDYGRICINGGGVITERVTYYIERDLGVLLVLCFLIILVVYYLSFHSKRSVLVPASMSIMGIIWALGTMAWMGYKLTIITILTPCLVLTLGSSYSIHMMSEYFSASKDRDKNKINIAFAKITKTILSASITTIIGFISMLICRTTLLREFGISVSIGVAYCALLAIVYLPAIFSIQKFPEAKKYKKIDTGIISKLLNVIVKIVLKYWFVVLIVLALIMCGYAYTNDKVKMNANYMEYFPSEDPFIIDSLYFANKMGGTEPYYFTIRAPEGESGFFLRPENLKKVYEFEETVLSSSTDFIQSLSFSQYVSFLNYVYTGNEGIPENAGLMNLLNRLLRQMENQMGSGVLSSMINEDATEMTLSIRAYDSLERDFTTTESGRRVEEMLNYYRYLLPEGTSSIYYCSTSDLVKASDMMMEDQNTATVLSLIGILIVATFTLSSLWRSIAAIIPVLVGIMFNYIFMYVTGIPFDLITIMFSSVTIGAGVDDALHFLLRYRLNKRLNPAQCIEDRIAETIRETGRPIILTSLSIDSGLLVLLFASYTPIQYYGTLMVVSLSVAMLSTLFILPVVLLLSHRIKKAVLKTFKRG